MRALSVLELLQVWEQGLAQSPTQRALTLLSAACPETPIKGLAELPIGQRDGQLLTLREWAFGSQLVSTVNCPNCGDRLELNFSIADIRVAADPPLPCYVLEEDDYVAQFRLPNTADLASVIALEPAIAQQQLLERCLIEIQFKQKPCEIAQVPSAILDSVIQQMALADPQAEVKIALTCPVCQHTWKSVFDIVSYFWDELNVWAVRLLREVHVLASAYGWREADILAMHPHRRQLYLQMVSR